MAFFDYNFQDPPISCLLLLTFATGNTKYKFENENEMNSGTVEPRSTDTRLIRTPGYCGQFRLSRRGKAHTFSLKLTHLIRTPVNMDTLACPIGVRINRVPL